MRSFTVFDLFCLVPEGTVKPAMGTLQQRSLFEKEFCEASRFAHERGR
jgi:hypothetical protein